MMNTLEIIHTVNKCGVFEMEKVGLSLDPAMVESCRQFSEHIRIVEAALLHTYRIISFAAVYEKDPGQAAALWKEMREFCDLALNALTNLKDRFPDCGAIELWDLALDYKIAANQRYEQNLQDSECQNLAIPAGLFPSKSL